MRNNQTGAITHHSAQLREDFLLCVGINRRQSIIEDQNPWRARHSPGNRRSLLLPARERDAALADHRVKAVREASNVLREPGNLGRPFDLGSLNLFDSKGNIVGERIAEQESLLWHIADAL